MTRLNNIYIASPVLWAFPLEQVIAIVHGRGIGGVEVWAEQVWYHRSSIREIIRLKDRFQMNLTSHAASWDLNIAALNRGIRRQSIRLVKRSILLAEAIGANNITIHPGRLTLSATWTDWHFAVLTESLQEISTFAQAHQAVISVEVMEPVKKEFIIDAPAVNRLLSQLPDSVMVTLDVAHLPRQTDFDDYFAKIKRINKIHLSDRSQDRYHLPLGQGDLDCAALLNGLRDSGLPLVIEGHDDRKDQAVLRENLDFLRRWLDSITK
jgi:sugar phosphate isomerase/epimerase